MPTHVVLLRGVNNLGSKKVTMAELQRVVSSLGHADVMTYIQSGNVLFNARRADTTAAGSTGGTDSAAIAAELELAIAEAIGVQARAVVLARHEIARYFRDNPYPGEPNPRLLHAIFLPEPAGPDLIAWVADAQRYVRANASRDQATVLGRAVYLHTPDGYPGSQLRRVLARTGGPTSTALAGTARNWATVSRLVELCGPRDRGEA